MIERQKIKETHWRRREELRQITRGGRAAMQTDSRPLQRFTELFCPDQSVIERHYWSWQRGREWRMGEIGTLHSAPNLPLWSWDEGVG